MSKLYFTESGRYWPTIGEEVTRVRRARKMLDLPATRHPAKLFILARPHTPKAQPLEIAVNGRGPIYVRPARPIWSWHDVELPASHLRQGANTIDLWADCSAMEGWSIAMQIGDSAGASAVSTDGGMQWSSGAMGYAAQFPGDYAIRIRLAERVDPSAPSMVWESDSQLLAAVLEGVPEEVTRLGPTLDRVRRICTWVAGQWEYYNKSPLPAPWDPATILAWGRAKAGFGGIRPTVHCVHYAVAFALICAGAGIPARCSAFTGAIPSAVGPACGHFVAEVWLEEFQKWVLVDPNLDGIPFDGSTPMSVDEVRDSHRALDDLMRWGPAHIARLQNRSLNRWFNRVYVAGQWMQYRAIWPRTDFLSRPDLCSAAHGQLPYSETDLVWEEGARDRGFDMFPLFAARDYFDAPPEDFPELVHLAYGLPAH